MGRLASPETRKVRKPESPQARKSIAERRKLVADGADAEECDLYAASCVADGVIRERDDVRPPHSVVEQQRQLLSLQLFC